MPPVLSTNQKETKLVMVAPECLNCSQFVPNFGTNKICTTFLAIHTNFDSLNSHCTPLTSTGTISPSTLRCRWSIGAIQKPIWKLDWNGTMKFASLRNAWHASVIAVSPGPDVTCGKLKIAGVVVRIGLAGRSGEPLQLMRLWSSHRDAYG